MSLETVHLFPITNTTLRNKPNDSPAVFNISLLGKTTNKQTRCFTVILGVLASIVCHLKYKVWQVFKHITVLSKHKNLGKQLTIYKSLKTAFPFSLDCFINWHAKHVYARNSTDGQKQLRGSILDSDWRNWFVQGCPKWLRNSFLFSSQRQRTT